MHHEELAQILTPTVKRSLADEVADRLRDAIMHGKLAPEEPLREAVLSDLMGVSRGPVREALAILEREGLVLTAPTGRTTVARLSHEELDDVVSLRKVLERLANYAAFSASGELARALRPAETLEEALKRLQVTSEARMLLDLNVDVTVGGVLSMA